MMNFYTGCVMSGKTKLLSNFLYLLRETEYLLIVPDLIYQDGNSFVKSRCEGYKGFNPNLRASNQTDLYDYVQNELKKNPEIRAIFVEELQFFTKNHIKQLERVHDELKLFVHCFGISKNHRDEDWETVEFFKERSNKRRYSNIIEIATVCNYCSEPATTNIRYDSNFSAKIDDCLNEDKQEKYLPCCRQCHRARRNMAEINKID